MDCGERFFHTTALDQVDRLLSAEHIVKPYPITLYPEPDGGYTVMLADLPGCLSQGDTLEESIANIKEAQIAWIETALECGDEIPVPE